MGSIVQIWNRWSGLVLLCWLSALAAWAQPRITSFSPIGGAVGTIVTVQGEGFGTSTSAADIVVTVGGPSGNGIVLTNQDTVLTFMVSTRSSTGRITISRPQAGTSVQSPGTYEFQSLTDLPDTTTVTTGQSLLLQPDVATPGSSFGSSIDINGNGTFFVVGNPGANGEVGEAYVYEVTNNCTYRRLATLSEAVTGTVNYGRDVSISANGDVIAIGGPRLNSDQGRVWVYRRVPGTTNWVKDAEFDGSSPGGTFGSSLDLSASGNTLAVGAPSSFGGQGLVANYRFDTGTRTWQVLGSLSPPSGVGAAANFGTDVAISSDGSTLAVGAPGTQLSTQPVGAVFVFSRVTNGVDWDQASAVRINPVGFTFDPGFQSASILFGSSVSLSIRGNNLVVGAPGDNLGIGAAFVFVRANNIWTQQGSKLSPPTDLGGRPSLGISVDIIASGEAFITGGFISGGRGFAWIYERTNDQTWRVRSTITNPQFNNSSFGRDVSLSTRGSLAVVGAPRFNNAAGLAVMYRPRLRIERIFPTEAAPGSTVDITGGGFLQGVTEVLVGTTPLPPNSYRVTSARTISLTVPNTSLQPGRITIRTICSPFAEVSSAETFRQLSLPEVLSVSPSSAAVGQVVTIQGRFFDPVANRTSVTIGGIAATIVEVPNETTIRVLVPNLPASGVIVVTTPVGRSTQSINLELVPPPSISGFSPTFAFIGDTVRLQGVQFKSTSTVRFGEVPARAVRFVSSANLSAVIDMVPLDVDTVRLIVSDPGGADTTDQFLRYSFPPPTFVTPSATSRPSAAVGTQLSIFGFNLRFQPVVRFGTSTENVTPIVRPGRQEGTVFLPDTLIVTVPESATSGSLVVTTKGGSNVIANYPIILRPSITDVLVRDVSTTTAGEAATVVILGQNLGSITEVTFGSTPVSILSISSTSISVRLGNLAPGANSIVSVGNIRLNWANSLQPVMGPEFFFNAGPAVNPSPRETSVLPYQWVTIDGQNLGGTRRVEFNGIASDSIQILSEIVIRVRAPLTPASGTICLTNRAGTIVCSSSPIAYNLAQPIVVSSVTPTRLSNNLPVILRGQNLALIDTVFFAGFRAANLQKLSSDSIRVIAQVSGSGAGPVAYIQSGNPALILSGRTITYGNPATLSFWSVNGVEWASGSQGTTVRFTGANFVAPIRVFFGGVPALSTSIGSSSRIDAVVDSGATGPIVIETANGTIISDSIFQFILREPRVTGFFPNRRFSGDTITITGQSFNKITSVRFGTIPATMVQVTRSEIRVVVPPNQGLSSAQITVSNPAGSFAFPTFFQWAFQRPEIRSFPPTAIVGDRIQIIGAYFDSSATQRVQVTFGSVVASQVRVISSTQLEVVVPANAGSSIVVTAAGGASLAAQPFRAFAPPQITAISPERGSPGDVITITGTSLSEASLVLIGGAPVFDFTVSPSGTSITATVGYGLSGRVTVTTPGGTAPSPNDFTHFFRRPVVESITPTVGRQGSQITIVGRNFYGQNSNGAGLSVSFGDDLARIETIKPDTLIVTLTTGATGRVTVTTGDSTSLEDVQFLFYRTPVIDRVLPDVVGPGAPIIISGSNLESENVTEFTLFGEVLEPGLYSSSGGNIITARVGSNANPSIRELKIVTLGGTATYSGLQYVPRPVISSLSPVVLAPGEVITIEGQNLSLANSLFFQNDTVPLASENIIDDNTITFTIPVGTPPGVATLYVISPGGISDISSRFTISGQQVRPSALLSEVLRIYPVPLDETDVLTLEGQLVQRNQELSILIVDRSGRIVLSRVINLRDPQYANGRIQEQFDLSALNPGMYFVNVISGREVAAWRFLKY